MKPRSESIRAALILAGAFLLAAGVGLAFSMSFESGAKPVADALTPAEIAAALPAPASPTMAVGQLSALRGRPPVKPLPRVRVRKHRAVRKARVRHVVRAVAAAAPAPVVRVAPRVVAQPRPAAPAPVAAPQPQPKPKPAPAPAKAPVVFDDSA